MKEEIPDDLLRRCLQGKLSPAEQEQLEKRLAEDPKLAEDLALQRAEMAGQARDQEHRRAVAIGRDRHAAGHRRALPESRHAPVQRDDRPLHQYLPHVGAFYRQNQRCPG